MSPCDCHVAPNAQALRWLPAMTASDRVSNKKATPLQEWPLISDLPVLSHLDLNFNTAWQFKLH